MLMAKKAPDEDVLGDRVVRVHLAKAWTVGALGGPALSDGQPEVLFIGGKACPHRVRPADLLKPGRDLAVIQVRVIAALAADELKRVGVAVICPARHDAGRPAPQARRAAVARLTSRRECREILVVTARRRITGIVRPA